MSAPLRATEYPESSAVGDTDRVVVMSGAVDLATIDGHIWEANDALDGGFAPASSASASSPSASAEPRGRLVVDLGGVTFMDSTGIGALIAIRNLAQARNCPMFLHRTPPRIRRLISLTGLSSVLPELATA